MEWIIILIITVFVAGSLFVKSNYIANKSERELRHVKDLVYKKKAEVKRLGLDTMVFRIFELLNKNKSFLEEYPIVSNVEAIESTPFSMIGTYKFTLKRSRFMIQHNADTVHTPDDIYIFGSMKLFVNDNNVFELRTSHDVENMVLVGEWSSFDVSVYKQGSWVKYITLLYKEIKKKEEQLYKEIKKKEEQAAGKAQVERNLKEIEDLKDSFGV